MKSPTKLIMLLLFVTTPLVVAQNRPLANDLNREENSLAQPAVVPPSDTAPDRMIDANGIIAFEEFSWGVRAFHEGLHNKALVNFEKALRLRPQEPLYRLWLGFANFYSGFNDAAINQWMIVGNNFVGGAWLRAKMDILHFRVTPYADNLLDDVWTVRNETAAREHRMQRFSRPTSVTSDPVTARTYVTGYHSNNIAIFDVNGSLRSHLNGGMLALDGPFDVVALPDGNLFVSEFRGGRITLLNRFGRRMLIFGNSPEQGSLSGPQYMAATHDGFLYVSDWTSHRVVKYDFNGNYIMAIGPASQGFGGLRSPTGVAVSETELFVADATHRVIQVFDHSGNFLRTLGEGSLLAPESITLYKGNNLLIADGRRVLSLSLTDSSVIEVTDLDGKAQKVMSVEVDRNGTFIVADNGRDMITYLTPRSSLYGGFFTSVRRVATHEFPTVHVLASVQTRNGTPVLGLNGANFRVEESGNWISDITVTSVDLPHEGVLTAALLVEASPEAAAVAPLFASGIADIYRAMRPQDRITLVWAGANPTEDNPGSVADALRIFNTRAPNITSPRWRFDNGLRLSVGGLLQRRSKLAVFFLTTGNDSSQLFNQYKPLDLALYLQNNDIAFYPIYVNANERNAVYDFIARETGGQSAYLFRPEGIGSLLNVARVRATGLYSITYNSLHSTSQGGDYIPIAIQASLQVQSGLTHSGYFAPVPTEIRRRLF